MLPGSAESQFPIALYYKALESSLESVKDFTRSRACRVESCNAERLQMGRLAGSSLRQNPQP